MMDLTRYFKVIRFRRTKISGRGALMGKMRNLYMLLEKYVVNRRLGGAIHYITVLLNEVATSIVDYTISVTHWSSVDL
jgi:hypothetical protein